MVEVPRADQERHLRAVIPEWLTRPPEVELVRRAQLAAEAREDQRVARHERRVFADTLRAAILLAAAIQLAVSGLAWWPLLGALALGAVLGALLHRLDEGVFAWVVAGALIGWFAARSDVHPFGLVIWPCVAGLTGTVVGIVRDPQFRL